MKNIKDISKQKFGIVFVEKFSHIEAGKRNKIYWDCICDCGNKIKMTTRQLKEASNICNCGCLTSKLKGKFFQEKNPKKTHGKSNTRLYKIYSKMKERCYYKNYPEKHLYSDRGIKICNEWLENFENFYIWAIENGYKDDLSIDRIDNNGNYDPNNCKWSTNIEQANNKRNNIVLEYKGKKDTFPNWCRKYNISYGKAKNRYKKNKSFEEIFDIC